LKFRDIFYGDIIAHGDIIATEESPILLVYSGRVSAALLPLFRNYSILSFRHSLLMH
jgi:hypothetical protein